MRTSRSVIDGCPVAAQIALQPLAEIPQLGRIRFGRQRDRRDRAGRFAHPVANRAPDRADRRRGPFGRSNRGCASAARQIGAGDAAAWTAARNRAQIDPDLLGHLAHAGRGARFGSSGGNCRGGCAYVLLADAAALAGASHRIEIDPQLGCHPARPWADRHDAGMTAIGRCAVAEPASVGMSPSIGLPRSCGSGAADPLPNA